MKERHKKHPTLYRRAIGKYHPNEWAIYGTTCSRIEGVVNEIAATVDASIIYIDADHSEDQSDIHQLQDGKKLFKKIAMLNGNEYDDRLRSVEADIALVNGNHYPATSQIVIIDSKKKDSLIRRKDQLDNIAAVICENPENEIFDFIEDRMTEETQVFDTIDSFLAWMNTQVEAIKPPLKMLILAGGKSSRMGENKAELVYRNGKDQVSYLSELASDLGIDSLVSVSSDYPEKESNGLEIVKDRMQNMGPFGAIVSAFMHDSSVAWLVVACDLPFLEMDDLIALIESRDSSKMASAIKAKSKDFPEPLVAIYEPKIYSRMLDFMGLGYACPRKVLINSDISILEVSDEMIVHNANTPDERKEALDKLKAQVDAE